MRKRFLKILSQLESMIAIRNAQVRSNPIPHLQEAYKELSEVRKVMNELVYTLSPEYIYDFVTHKTTLEDPRQLQGKELIANKAALKIIKEYLKS